MVSHRRWDKGYVMIELDIAMCVLGSTTAVWAPLPLNERAGEQHGGSIGGLS